MEQIVVVDKLSKLFGNFKAVDNLSFSVNRGDIYGFLGQNGAGKSTTIRMLLGLIHPTSGFIEIGGEKLSKNKTKILKNVGAVVERPDLYNYLSGWSNLKMFARLSDKSIGSKRLEEVLDIVGLKGREHDKVKAYSQGMKQRLGIAIAMVHNPDLLILDEPTNGLDPQGIVEIRQLILSLGKEHGKTVIISSHLLNEIELVANRMLIIHKGEKAVEGAVNELLNPDDMLVDVRVMNGMDIVNRIKSSESGKLLHDIQDNIIRFKTNADNIPNLTEELVKVGVQISEIRSRHSLEDYFLNLTNQKDVKA